jgi:hypothetical protein
MVGLTPHLEMIAHTWLIPGLCIQQKFARHPISIIFYLQALAVNVESVWFGFQLNPESPRFCYFE